ncbi:hypothetical protein ACIRBY_23410 [Streptomyces sp. NPDC096136]|uniref:hypothetical protein n=1 Tax=Streptomyces sp. NPDC096136 TaxID=3366076 RepID=UPI00381C967B
MSDRPITPSGCRHCGIPKGEHARRWKQPAGWHAWEPPSDRQILARMQMRRRLARQEGQ